MKGLIAVTCGVLLSSAAWVAQAAPVQPCALTDVTGNLGGSTACYGPVAGNDPFPNALNVLNWGELEAIQKYEVDKNKLEGTDIGLTVTGTVLKDDGDWIGGTWSFNPGQNFEAFAIVIKAANNPGWAAYLFDGAAAASYSGEWIVPWKKGLSHLTVYARIGDSQEPAPVPEPGSWAMLLLGLAGLLGKYGRPFRAGEDRD